MIRWVCPQCRAESDVQAGRCVNCGSIDGGTFEQRLQDALRHKIPETAALAAMVLANRKCDDAVPALIAASLSSEPLRAESALKALGAFPEDERAHGRLRDALIAGTAQQRSIASEILERRP